MQAPWCVLVGIFEEVVDRTDLRKRLSRPRVRELKRRATRTNLADIYPARVSSAPDDHEGHAEAELQLPRRVAISEFEYNRATRKEESRRWE